MLAFCSRSLLMRQVIKKAQHVSCMEECLTMARFWVSQIYNPDKIPGISSCTKQLIEMGMFETCVLTTLPIDWNRDVNIRIVCFDGIYLCSDLNN